MKAISMISTTVATVMLVAVTPILAQGPTAEGEGLASGSPPAPSLYLDLDSRLWIEGTSTVRDFTCEAGVIAGTFRTNPVEAPLSMGSLEKVLSEATVEIPAPQLDCSNDTMNDHMWNALRAEEEPDIRFEFDRYRVLPQGTDTASLALPGDLTMAGTTRPITVAGQAIPQGDGSVRVLGTSELNMTEWNVKPPSLMFGVMKVGEVVEVHFDLVVRTEQPASD